MMDKETYEEAVWFAQRVRHLSPCYSYGRSASRKLGQALERFAKKKGLSGDIIEEFIEKSETQAWAWDILCDMVVRELYTGQPDLPVNLCLWAADMTKGICSRPRKGRVRPSNGIVIADTVHIVRARFGVTPTRSGAVSSDCCAEGGSACDIVGSAQIGKVRAYKTIEEIWGDYKEYSQTCWSEEPWEQIMREWARCAKGRTGSVPLHHTRLLHELGIRL